MLTEIAIIFRWFYWRNLFISGLSWVAGLKMQSECSFSPLSYLLKYVLRQSNFTHQNEVAFPLLLPRSWSFSSFWRQNYASLDLQMCRNTRKLSCITLTEHKIYNISLTFCTSMPTIIIVLKNSAFRWLCRDPPWQFGSAKTARVFTLLCAA